KEKREGRQVHFPGEERARVDVRSAARQLGVSRWTVARWIKQGRLPAFRPGLQKLLVDRDELQHLKAERDARRRERQKAARRATTRSKRARTRKGTGTARRKKAAKKRRRRD